MTKKEAIETNAIVNCHDYCVKLRHTYEGVIYYLRTCADTLKKIHIKKTEVCYASRSKTGGHLCFCEQDLCNKSQSSIVTDKKNIYFLLFILFIFYFN